MKSAEEMTRDVLRRRDDELIKRKKRRRTLAVAAGALAACLLLAVLVIPRLQKGSGDDGTKIAEGESTKTAEDTNTAETASRSGENETSSNAEAPRDVTSQPEPTTEDPFTKVIWTAEGWSSAGDAERDDTTISDHVEANKYLAQALEKAKDDDVLAFIFSPKLKGDRTYGGSAESEKLAKRWNDLSSYSYELWERLVNELMDNNPEMTGTEANARVSNMPEYQQACNEAYQAEVDVSAFENREIFEGMEDTLAVMQKKGFTVLCTNAEDSYVDYVDWYSGMAVLSGTAAQIKSLTLEGFGKDIERLKLLGTKPVERDPEEFGDGKYPIHLQDDSKLTDELRAAYAQNGGAPVKVIVKMGWLGEWVDPHEYAYAALGMTAREFNEATNLTNAQVDKYYEVLNYYTYWLHEDVVDSILEEGELVERREWVDDFVAMLSEERALEICQLREGHEQVAYIMPYDKEVNRNPETWPAYDD